MAKWIPVNETIGVPGELDNEPGGFIRASDFNEGHLKKLVFRAINRKIDVDTFLMKNAGLRKATREDVDAGIDDTNAKKESPLDVEIKKEEKAKSNK